MWFRVFKDVGHGCSQLKAWLGLRLCFEAHLDCCWPEASILHHLCLSIVLLMTRQLASPKTNYPRKRENNQDQCFSVFYNLISKVTCYHFRYILWVAPADPYRVRGDYMKMWIPRSWDYWDLFWRLAASNNNDNIVTIILYIIIIIIVYIHIFNYWVSSYFSFTNAVLHKFQKV